MLKRIGKSILQKSQFNKQIYRQIFKTNNLFSAIKQIKGDTTIHEDIANWLRIDSIRAINITKSGHPTSCASIAQIMSVLFFHEEGIKFHFNNTKNFLNDRLVLSKGHAAPILYSALYRAKVISQKDLLSLRLKDSIYQGHPVPDVPFVDVATGSLGQGLSVSAGMAYSSKYFDKINNRIYCIVGDGQMAQGNIWEALDFAHNYKLNNLTLILDMNRLGQSQPAMHEHKTDIFARKLQAFGWAVQVINGHSISQILTALQKAKKQINRPTAIICKTIKGKNLGNQIQNKQNWHGKDLGNKTNSCIDNLKSMIKSKNIQFNTFPPIGTQPEIIKKKTLIKPNYSKNDKISSRKAYGLALLKARESNPNIVGLDADTKNSTFSITLKQKYPQSFIECYIAQQNLIGVATGLSCRNKIPFCSSFAAFLMRGADQIRIAGIGNNPIKIVGSHSGCSIGQDGPSQMALQDLGFFRNIPKGVVISPSDGVSTQKAVEIIANYNDGPCFIRTSRPEVPILYQNDQTFELGKCKVIKKSKEDKLLLVSHGVIVHECIKAYQAMLLKGVKIRVIDLFSIKPLDEYQIKKSIKQCHGVVIVAQQHYAAGGAYQALCGVAAQQINKIRHICVTKTPKSAQPYEQLQLQGLDAQSILKTIHKLLQIN